MLSSHGSQNQYFLHIHTVTSRPLHRKEALREIPGLDKQKVGAGGIGAQKHVWMTCSVCQRGLLSHKI